MFSVHSSSSENVEEGDDKMYESLNFRPSQDCIALLFDDAAYIKKINEKITVTETEKYDTEVVVGLYMTEINEKYPTNKEKSKNDAFS
jgi:hypothetical protein